MEKILPQAELKKVIEDAFANTTPPTNRNLSYFLMAVEKGIEQTFDKTTPHPTVDAATMPYQTELGAVFGSKTWQEFSQELSQESIPLSASALWILLSDEAFRYFYPAYMLAAVKGIEEREFGVAIQAVQALKNLAARNSNSFAKNVTVSPENTSFLKDPSTISKERSASYRERVNGFTMAQKKAMISFLTYIAAKPSATLQGSAKEALEDVMAVWGDI